MTVTCVIIIKRTAERWRTYWSHGNVRRPPILLNCNWTGCTQHKIDCPSSTFCFWIQFEKHLGLYVTHNFLCWWLQSAHFTYAFDVISEAHPNWHLARPSTIAAPFQCQTHLSVPKTCQKVLGIQEMWKFRVKIPKIISKSFPWWSACS